MNCECNYGRIKSLNNYVIKQSYGGGWEMYKHHEKSIENMKEYFKKRGAIALILVGSVAKGIERVDSDLDGMVIVSEEEYAEKEKNNKTTETIDSAA